MLKDCYLRDCFYGGVYDFKLVEGFLSGCLGSSTYYDLDGVGNVQYEWVHGMGRMGVTDGEWVIWMKWQTFF